MKTIFLSGLFAGCVFLAQAQEDTTKREDKNVLVVGLTYANNANYYGQKPEEKTPYLAAVASWRLKSGIYFTGSAFRLLNDSARLASASSLGLGYEFEMGEKMTADVSYTRAFYPAHSPFLQAANNNVASATLNYKYFLTSGIGVDYAFGKQNDVFVTFSTAKEIELGKLFSKNDGVSIAPRIEVVGGTQRFYTTYVEEKRLRDSILGLPVPPIFGGEGSTGTTTTRESASFDLLTYNLQLPLSYYRSNYLIELSYQLSVLSNKVKAGGGSANSFVNISFYYQF